ncbi:MAG: BON domain-containing protein [Betaproteobacteria bacterium]|nr:BON domain-containing protein [Betaproteobacteria bacterium]
MRSPFLFALSLLAAGLLSGCAPVIVGGAGVGVLMTEDRRTVTTYLMDEEIELKAAHRTSEAKLDKVHANFTSYNRRVLITGEAPTEALKARVGEIARGVENVREGEVKNEMQIAAPTSLVTRSNDVLLTTQVKAGLFNDRRINANQIKVVTENGVVFLMGIVKPAEGNAAAETASKVSGVTRVIKVFEDLR